MRSTAKTTGGAVAQPAPFVRACTDEAATAAAAATAPAGLGTRTRCDHTRAWSALGAHYDSMGRSLDMRDAFAADPGRYGALSQEAPHVFADLSRNRVDAATEALLLQLARECGL